LAVTIAVSFVIGAFMSRVHILFPTVFPEKASFAYLDALTTIASFTAMWLLAQKRIESWYYWIAVDVIRIGLYYVKGVRFIALLYVILLGMAINGLISWNKTSRTPEDLVC
jgi:nicotinamide mononucleotide transporter